MKVAPDQCIVCRRRSLRGLEPLVNSEGRKASIHEYHRITTIYGAGFSIDLQMDGKPLAPGAWTLK